MTRLEELKSFHNAARHRLDGMIKHRRKVETDVANALLDLQEIGREILKEERTTTTTRTKLSDVKSLYNAVITLYRKSGRSKEIIPELQHAVRMAEMHREDTVSELVLELAEAVDNNAADIGGSRGERTILNEAYAIASARVHP